MQAALTKRAGDSVQGENKQWLLIAQCVQKKTLPWGCLSLTPNGFLLLWLPGTVPDCARLPFCPHLSLALISFLAKVMGLYTIKSPTDTVPIVCEIPLPPFCTAATSSFSTFFPPSPPPQHHHPVPCATSFYGHNSEASLGVEHDTEPCCCMVRNK